MNGISGFGFVKSFFGLSPKISVFRIYAIFVFVFRCSLLFSAWDWQSDHSDCEPLQFLYAKHGMDFMLKVDVVGMMSFVIYDEKNVLFFFFLEKSWTKVFFVLCCSNDLLQEEILLVLFQCILVGEKMIQFGYHQKWNHYRIIALSVLSKFFFFFWKSRATQQRSCKKNCVVPWNLIKSALHVENFENGKKKKILGNFLEKSWILKFEQKSIKNLSFFLCFSDFKIFL